MTSRLILGLIAIAGLLGCSTIAPPTDAITKTQSRELPARVVTDVVMDQLADILIFDQPRSSLQRPPTRPLEEAWFFTTPRPAAYPGLCTTELLIVHFEPLNNEDRGPETPVRARSIEAAHLYQFIDDPQENGAHTDPAIADPRCARLDPRSLDFFEADEEQTAQNAGVLLALALEQVAHGELLDKIECNRRSDCVANLRETSLNEVRLVSRCSQPEQGYCYRYNADHSVDIEARQTSRGGGPLRWEITRISVNDLIVMYHPRPD